ncbi:acyltransferase domain-containing protein [Streptomyces sp. NPDC002181]|uniref:acyltransferase domain-containing protein n=1 Tax=Streptomyces sp. NPDC002181 TaxID=3364635 RepID=UPI003682D4CB
MSDERSWEVLLAGPGPALPRAARRSPAVPRPAGRAAPAPGAAADRTPGQAVLFTARGPLLPGSGRDLYGTCRPFAKAWNEVAEALDAWLPLPLAAVVFAPRDGVDSALIRDAAFAQPALFAHHIALFRVWEAWGVEARAVAGHAVGEISAAHVAGVLDLDDAARMVTVRGRLAPHDAPHTARAASERRFLRVARACRLGAPTRTLVCATTGELLGPRPGERAVTPEHFLSRARAAPSPAAAQRALETAGFPRTHLCGPDARDTAPGSEVHAVLTSLGRLHHHGHPIAWPVVFAETAPP